jgi:phosphoribosylformimino-5-aminoimidazole carboxamide ribotide isomerase
VIAYAAIDLRGGRVVQLVGGRVEDEKISLPDPLAVALGWTRRGFAALHIVDLDGALESGSNRDVMARIIERVDVPVQVGGGIRSEDDVAYWLDRGAARVIVGTRAVEEAAWRKHVTRRFKDRVIVAADVRDRAIVTRGWTAATSLEINAFISSINDDPLCGVLVTDVSREGQMTGADTELFGELVKESVHPLIAAGGIRDESDLRGLAAVGVAGAVLGMALYQGAIDPASVAAAYA